MRTPERLAEIRAKLDKPLGNHTLRSDCADLLAAYEAQARKLALARAALASAREALEKIAGAGAWDAARIASEALTAIGDEKA